MNNINCLKQKAKHTMMMMCLLTKQKRWRTRSVALLLFRRRPRVITALLLLLMMMMEPTTTNNIVEAAAASFIISAQKPRRFVKYDGVSSIIITKTTSLTRIISRAKGGNKPFHTFTCANNSHPNGCCCRRRCYSLLLRRAKLEEADDDGDDDNKNKDEYSTKAPSSSSQKQQKEDSRSLEDKVDNFLDQEFFNPSTVDAKSPFKWFANLVERDYETAEALYASAIIVMLVILSQELLRMQINGLDHYVPFTRSAAIGGGSSSNGLW